MVEYFYKSDELNFFHTDPTLFCTCFTMAFQCPLIVLNNDLLKYNNLNRLIETQNVNMPTQHITRVVGMNKHLFLIEVPAIYMNVTFF